MKKDQVYTAAVVGLGRIGLGYDYSCNDDKSIMTHSSAYFYHFGYELVGAVDPDAEKRELFTKKYHLPAYETLEEMCKHSQPDVYSLAAPTDQHYELFSEMLSYSPKAILCEKPVSNSVEKASEMARQAMQNNVMLFVNYMRRFEPGVHRVKLDLDQGKIGKIYKVVVKYSNGFLNCATHFLDLVQFLFGKIDAIERIGSRDVTDTNDDIDVRCRISDIDLYFLAMSQGDYSFYELEAYGEQGILRYCDAGRDITSYLSAPDTKIERSRTISKKSTVYDTSYDRFQWHVVDAMYQALLQGDVRASNIDDAISVLNLVKKVMN